MRSIISSLLLAVTLVVAAFGTACSDDDDRVEVQAGLDLLVRAEVASNDFLGLGVSVRLADGRTFRSAAGHSDPDGEAVYDVAATEQVIGSTTKLYTAVLVMQLVERHQIGLDDTVDRWLDFPGAGAITVRMLLNHTSGLNDFLNLMTLEQLGQPWAPEQLVELALAGGPVGAPGMEKAIYSNTNFVVLAMIVEAQTGKSWEDNVDERIVAPLGLIHTYFPRRGERGPLLAGGWLETEAGWLDTLTLFDPSVGWAAGAMVSTNAELFRFTEALFDGELFDSPATLAQMRRFETEADPAYLGDQPPTRIGLALMSTTFDGVTLEGHLGHIEGYNTAAQRDAETGAIIVVSSNDNRASSGPIAFDVAKYLRDR